MEDSLEFLRFFKALNPRLWRRTRDAIVLLLAVGLALGTGWATDVVDRGVNALVDYQTEKFARILDDVTESLMPTVTTVAPPN